MYATDKQTRKRVNNMFSTVNVYYVCVLINNSIGKQLSSDTVNHTREMINL